MDRKPYFSTENAHMLPYDLQIIGPNLKVIEELKSRLFQCFKMTDLGPTSHYLGMEVHMSKGALTITQKTCVEKIFESHQISDCSLSPTPMIDGSSLEPTDRILSLILESAQWLFILNRRPISWASRKQPTVSTSTCEAEYIAPTEAVCEAVGSAVC